ncbi:hypothetical protein HBH56_016820 [Parastagonospora nodorum]|uniref:Uncharacterized protein n=1 Tax=Phaeosphaeria nodorum (strain SN15 / ATCC MYA-4574 / FGSC 10173) TaxID=321614 RepID=A0A7U2F1T3_PHANO|nr:hypothetical protein HBH56_016820 [Parastagonospora nodorum]QRC95135.1 hypothetical protein JI435_302010 [Parastagonospora nodorum SN15]KAH3937347.1 hypothetical protein HBH54_017650 [Parastagonospora nodorum]KAH3953456.1 hypothetical protein HBH53_030020 [Parastagonospora nodorum]KAH3969483.1 hypothetical protein HBH51_122170 [Parastagonospora nodorum]
MLQMQFWFQLPGILSCCVPQDIDPSKEEMFVAEQGVPASRKAGGRIYTHDLCHLTYRSPHLDLDLCISERAPSVSLMSRGCLSAAMGQRLSPTTKCKAHRGATDVTMRSMSFSCIRGPPLFVFRRLHPARSISYTC